MKKALIVALVCVNVALLAALIGVNLNRAEAQTERGGNDYIMVTAQIEATPFDAVFVVDLKTRRMAGWRFDRTTKRMVPYKGRDLKADFKRR